MKVSNIKLWIRHQSCRNLITEGLGSIKNLYWEIFPLESIDQVQSPMTAVSVTSTDFSSLQK